MQGCRCIPLFLIQSNQISLSTNKKSTLNMFSDYTRTEQDKFLLESPQSCYWFGQPSAIGETLNAVRNNYAARIVKSFYRRKAFLAMDIDKQAVIDILNKIQMGEGSQIAFVTRDGAERLEAALGKFRV